MDWMRWLSVVLVVALLVTGSPGLVAWAQQTQEYEYSPTGTWTEESGGPAYSIGAGIATAVTVPMRAATCLVGGALGFAVLAVTLGSGYRTAMAIAEEGCQSPWVLTEDEMRAGAWDDLSRP